MVRDWSLLLLLSILLPLWVGNQTLRKILVWGLPGLGVRLLFLHRAEPPWVRLLAASAGMIFVMKGSVMATYPRPELRKSRPGLFLVWPGMDPTKLTRTRTASDEDARPIAHGLYSLYLGLALILFAAFVPVGPIVAGWCGIVGLLLAIHCGLSDVLSGIFQVFGLGVDRLFDRPLAAITLNEFWTRRWNIPFVEMDRRLFLPALRKLVGAKGSIVAVFLISGLLHEMAISYPAGGGWGLPLVYFALQGSLVLIERKLRLKSRSFTLAAVLIPLPLVFTGLFRSTFILPFLGWLREGLSSQSLSWYFERGIWIMGCAHFLVLIASFQVPGKLNWREELPRLSSFNRKLMYAYGAFIVLTIVTFGAFTLSMRNELLHGSPAALFFAGFIALFWALRLGIDGFYYRHEDWPKGTQFVIGHALLNSLFMFLCLSYGSLVVWRAVT